MFKNTDYDAAVLAPAIWKWNKDRAIGNSIDIEARAYTCHYLFLDHLKHMSSSVYFAVHEKIKNETNAIRWKGNYGKTLSQ